MATASKFVPTCRPEAILGTSILQLDARSDLQVVERLAGGLDTKSVERLSDYLGLTVPRTLDLAGIKSSTFHERKKRHRPLSAEESGKLFRSAWPR